MSLAGMWMMVAMAVTVAFAPSFGAEVDYQGGGVWASILGGAAIWRVAHELGRIADKIGGGE